MLSSSFVKCLFVQCFLSESIMSYVKIPSRSKFVSCKTGSGGRTLKKKARRKPEWDVSSMSVCHYVIMMIILKVRKYYNTLQCNVYRPLSTHHKVAELLYGTVLFYE